MLTHVIDYEPKDARDYAKLLEFKDLIWRMLPGLLCPRIYPGVQQLSADEQAVLLSGLELAVADGVEEVLSTYNCQSLEMSATDNHAEDNRLPPSIPNIEEQLRLITTSPVVLMERILDDSFATQELEQAQVTPLHLMD